MNYQINGVIFEWNDEKYDKVLQDHDVTFEEACTVFFDDKSISKDDNRYYDEKRIITVGMSNQARLLTVVWTLRDDSIRLITAFKSTKPQEKRYANG